MSTKGKINKNHYQLNESISKVNPCMSIHFWHSCSQWARKFDTVEMALFNLYTYISKTFKNLVSMQNLLSQSSFARMQNRFFSKTWLASTQKPAYWNLLSREAKPAFQNLLCVNAIPVLCDQRCKNAKLAFPNRHCVNARNLFFQILVCINIKLATWNRICANSKPTFRKLLCVNAKPASKKQFCVNAKFVCPN